MMFFKITIITDKISKKLKTTAVPINNLCI